jgi:hypothetical protein
VSTLKSGCDCVFLFQDTYYDIVDALDGQDLEAAMKKMTILGNKDLTEQCKIYEKVLSHEDTAGDSDTADSPTVKMRLVVNMIIVVIMCGAQF